MKSRPTKPINLALALLAPVMLVAGIWLGGHPQRLPGFVRQGLVADQDTRVISEALDTIDSDYYRRLGRGQLVDAAISGIVSRLSDRFSNYFNPHDYGLYVQESNSTFSGVGLSIVRDPRGLRVRHVYDGSPAAHAGLLGGDVVIAVNGRSLAGVPERVATQRIMGPPGTAVSLTVRRGRQVFHRRLVRATVNIPVVASRLRTLGHKKLAVVALAQFSDGAHGELRQAIDHLLRQGARGVLLDLRANPGGLVEEARLVASIFLAQGTIVTTRGRTQPTTTLTATGGAISSTIPVVVTVDRGTASAAEIVTGALQDRRRATVVGTHTFGKGVFQEVDPLSNGGALDITVGEYFTPNGHNLGGGGVKRGAGITPNVFVAAHSTARRDPALDVALRILAAKVR